MKHIVARAFSTVRTNFKFGAPGLGDRIHHILFAYNYSVMENTPVTLHLTKYQWNKNCGYGTKVHIQAIRKFGITKHHRRTFKPIHNILSPR